MIYKNLTLLLAGCQKYNDSALKNIENNIVVKTPHTMTQTFLMQTNLEW